MSNYQRLISYIYTYEGGIKGKNIGFAKIETRNIQSKITVNVKKIFVGGNPMGVYLLSNQGELKIGTLFARNGAGEFRTTVNSANIEDSGRGVDEFYGLSVHDVESAWRAYTTIWEDAVAHSAEEELAGVTSENLLKKQEPEEEKALPISKEIEEELKLESDLEREQELKLETESEQELFQKENYSAGEPHLNRAKWGREGVGVRESLIGTGFHSPVLAMAEMPQPDIPQPDMPQPNIPQSNIPQSDISQPDISQPTDFIPAPKEEKETKTHQEMWEILQKKFAKILAFDYEDGCEILIIKPQDIGLLPRENWVHGNNSFLLHGYYNYRYLILARLENPQGVPRYLLGVPGNYFSNEKYMAAMFAFPDFVLSKKQPSENSRFGYWYADIKIGD